MVVPAPGSLRYFTPQDVYDFTGLSSTGSNDNFLDTSVIVRVGLRIEKEIDSTLNTTFGSSITSVDPCEVTTGWTGSTDATAIALTTTPADIRSRDSALDMGKSGVTEAFAHYRKTQSTTQDFTDKTLYVWVNLVNLTGLPTNGRAVTIKYGTDSDNYYEKVHYLEDLITGWNLLSISVDTATNIVGAPTTTAQDFLEIRFETTDAATIVASGIWIMDSWILVANIFKRTLEHIDARGIPLGSSRRDLFDERSSQRSYFLRKLPVKEVLYLAVNKSAEYNTPVWIELVEADDDFKLDLVTGRVRISDAVDFPAKGARQVRTTYVHGHSNIPEDLRQLAVLMTVKSLMTGTVMKAIMSGRSEFGADAFGSLDDEINMIKTKYRQYQMTSV